MSADPQPERREESSALGDSSWARALTQRAALQEQRSRQRQRIQQALEAGAEDLLYPWSTAEGRELDMRVYYLPGSTVDVRVAELERIDGRPPTLRERFDYEGEFARELEAASDLWEAVASYVWEK